MPDIRAEDRVELRPEWVATPNAVAFIDETSCPHDRGIQFVLVFRVIHTIHQAMKHLAQSRFTGERGCNPIGMQEMVENFSLLPRVIDHVHPSMIGTPGRIFE